MNRIDIMGPLIDSFYSRNDDSWVLFNNYGGVLKVEMDCNGIRYRMSFHNGEIDRQFSIYDSILALKTSIIEDAEELIEYAKKERFQQEEEDKL